MEKINQGSGVAAFVRAARARMGLSQEAFAFRHNCTKANVSAWENGRHEPSYAVLAEIAQQSGVPLPLSHQQPHEVAPLPSRGLVPLIAWIRAGDWCDAHAAGDAEDWLPCPTRHGVNTFALRVVGDSMDGPGGYREGEVIFVDPDAVATPGRDVVARTPDGRVTFKRLKEDEAGQYLLALNPAWPERIIRVPTGTTVCGVVIGSFTPR